MKSMNELMLHFVQDIYYAERLGVREMQKLARAVESGALKEAILQHRDQSQQHLSRLERVFELMGKRPRGKTCAAMDGLVEEAHEQVEEGEKGPIVDAALLATAQAIDHYEIARYGAIVAWAQQTGMDEAAGLLQQSLDEEKANDAKLNELALRSTNQEAEHVGEGHAAEQKEEKPAPRRTAARSRKAADSKPVRPAAPPKKPATRRSASRK